MDLATAQAAGELAAYIKPRVEMLAKLDQMLSEGWFICGVQAVDANGGSGTSLMLDTLDPQTSALVLGYTKQIYEQQVAAAQSQLDAL